ncbi:signal transduction histidine kinase [Aneurinibacillus soli]|uniref:histidine kinase n=1 Tax=Aneurinibacillus soli TaxID=1500254 RepID=A0A0U5BDY7_9BACL|nr:HAMP domain-containing sensor histidine kinase [Aneurinibacillus soli]PYE61231.1 signal transduction histidine kinase [Aneurinibacillus soli]BAU26334.1 Alkaline phosphatase synthesis sensor protein PhoR [Aneurinibacillus soli]
MDIKSKNKMRFFTWILLFTFGVSGIFTGICNGKDYMEKDYFHTQQFEDQLNQFVEYLKLFEFTHINKEDLKKKITVTAEEINEHRYRYGDLSTQTSNIKGQYGEKIKDALTVQNKEVADMYVAERDKKIADITNNFKSDDYVRAKIVEEKEQQIDQYLQEIESRRSNFMNDKALFRYYLKNTTTEEVYTNVDTTGGSVAADAAINDKSMLFIQNYPSEKYGELSNRVPSSLLNYNDVVTPLLEKGEVSTFEGKIGVPNGGSSTNPILVNYYDFLQKQKVFFIYVISSIFAFVLSLYLNKKRPVIQLIPTEKWQSYYNRIPLDVAGMTLVFTGFLSFLLFVVDNDLYIHQDLYKYSSGVVFRLMVAACLVSLTLIQRKFWVERAKERVNIKSDWQKSLLYRAYKGLREAFAVQRMGTQVFILLSVVFACGFGAVLVLAKNELILLYAPLFIVIGVPSFFVIIKWIGYFNRIVINTSGLVHGNIEPDLPVVGKSTLAVLAGNINTLKHGIKVSQKEQAKSERLKTELITNVSHDLRTPLTSIITYTELLKTPNLADEERNTYIEIIDRKSKRLQVLIDDLFEASKMASGNIELVKEKVDLVQLLQQALAEYNEAIKESTLQVRVTHPDTSVYAVVDGQKLWRVFDNLIGNMLKYSLENTRVYISVKPLRDEVVITFKNVTKYELSENIDELFERFKRGDTSRHTEGSGLGLAIAKSIIDLHEGNLDIEVDGDLFKVTVVLNIKES